jgi:alginate O-acetyltransferase complex protein AlgJ
MVRTVHRPTEANLDLAAYMGNPVRYDPQPFRPKKPAKKITLADCSFGGTIVSPCTSPAQTPLSENELSQPFAWDPLQNRLWQVTKIDLFARITGAVNGKKWADSSIYTPYQEIVCAYIHGSGDTASLWVKIEFKPWVTFIDGLVDEDRDGFRECYGRIESSAVDHALLKKAINWMASDYAEKLLTKEEVIDWANTLASYWYPKFNTDVVDMTGASAWPTPETEQEIRREMKGFSIANPLVVIRGNPYGKVIYNVFVVDFPARDTAAIAPVVAPQATRPAAKTDSVSLVAGVIFCGTTVNDSVRLALETKSYGDYEEWTKKEEPFRRANLDYLKSLPKEQMAFSGKDGWLFFRNEIEYLNSGDLALQPPADNPLPRLREFNKLLEKQGITLLFCPVPNKSDVYFEKLPAGSAPADSTIINPYSRKFLSDLRQTGIGVIDLLPLFLSAKREDAQSKESLFQKHDTHWTSRGLTLAAKYIAGRIRRLVWYGEASKNLVRYRMRDTAFLRQGDLVDKLPGSEQSAYPADEINGQQILNPDGSLYKANNPDAPILLIGDSFTGVFELVDCKGAGVGAHIAAETGLPVDVITSWGGGPLVRDKMLRARKNMLSKKRVVVYLMAARDLYHYSQHWEPVEEK